jgi:chromosome segregation ATPase
MFMAGTSSRDFVEESNMDARLHAEFRVAKLEEDLMGVRKENARFRAQFEELQRISTQIDEVHQKNLNLNAAVRDLTAENDCLRKRLDIALRANGELSQKVEDEKRTTITQRDVDATGFQDELQRTKSQANQQIDAIYAQLHDVQHAKEQVDIEQKITANKIEKLVRSASQFFDTNFSTIDAVTDRLSELDIPPAVLPSPVIEAKPIEVVERYEKKVKLLRLRLKEAIAARADMQDELTKALRENSEVETRFKQQLDDQRNALRIDSENRALMEASHEHEVKLLQNKIEILNQELKSLPVVCAPQIPPTVPEKVKVRHCSRANRIATQELLQRCSELEHQAQLAQDKRDAYRQKLREIEARNAELDVAVQQMKLEQENATMLHKKTIAELETVRKALHQTESQEDRFEKSKLKRDLRSQKSEINNLQKTIISLETQLHELTVARNELARTIDQQTGTITQLKQSLADDARRIDRMQVDLSRAEYEAKSRNVPTLEDLFPPTLWRTNEFDSELNAQISRIVVNPALQHPSKLQNIYRTINAHFTAIVQSQNRALDEAYSENQAIRSLIQEFLVTLSISLGIQPVSFTDFFSQQLSEKLLSEVSKLKLNRDDLRRANDQLNLAFGQIRENLNLSPDQEISSFVQQQIMRLKDQIERQANDLQRRRKKCHDLNDRLKSLQTRYDRDLADVNSQVQILNETVETSTKQVDQMTLTNQSLRKELQILSSDRTDFEIRTEEARIAAAKEFESQLRAEREAQEALEVQLREEIARFAECGDSLARSNSTIKMLKKTIRAHQDTISEKEQNISVLKREFQEMEQQLVNNREQEKAHLTETYKLAQAELQAQCDAHRNHIQHLVDDLTAADRRTKDVRGQLVELRRENLTLQKEIHAQEEQFDREKRLHEAAVKAAIVRAESNAAGKLSEQKAQADGEKRRILAFVADSFKQFFNPQDVIDERSCKQVVGRAKEELAKLSDANATVRRIVRAAAHERTEDAVAQAVMGRM